MARQASSPQPVHSALQTEATEEPRIPVVALAGSPNVGKSSIFNPLTGLSQHVGNWPGKTVEQKTGVCTAGPQRLQIVDLPGTYSLTANSAEEQVTRDYILRERPEVVVAVVNAANLERTLYLVSELLELPSPLVVALNMIDVAASNGIHIEPNVLQSALGVPVVPLVASRSEGITDLLQAIESLLCGSFAYAPVQPNLGAETERLLARVEALIGDAVPPSYPKRWFSLKLLEGDQEASTILHDRIDAERWDQLQTILRANEDAVLSIASARYEWIGRMVRAAVVRPRADIITLTERLDRVATHTWAGPLLLIGILALVFWAVFQLSGPLVTLLEIGIGWASDWLRRVLVGAPAWLVEVLTEGVLGGAGTVLTLLPVLAIFFAAIAFLEDVGYLARGAFIADRLMHHMGLHGKSFLPLFLGFGCNVPAVLGTRILDSQRDRLLTLLLAPMVPCAGRIVVVVFVAGALFGQQGALVIMGLLILSLAMLVLSGALLNRLLFRGAQPALILELPLYHWPNWKTIGLYTWQRVRDFVTRAGTVILGLSVVIWALAALPSGQMETSYLAGLGRLLAPVGNLLGLDWRMMVALLASLVAKEQTLATLAVLTATEEASLSAVLPQMLSPAAGIAFLIVQMLFVPCVATLTAIRQESGSWRWTLFSIAHLATLSFGVAILAYQAAGLLGVGV